MTASLPMPCTGRPDSPGAGDCPDKRGTLIATVAGSSLAFVVGSIINVALPTMEAEFAAGPTGVQWIVNAYLLPLGALVLLGGAMGDHYGRKRIFQAGLLIFSVACVLCAVAWNFPVLILGRALEGVGAAMIAPTSLAIIADGFSGKERGAAIGTWAAAGAIAGAVAPVLGGLAVDSVGWRWAFAAVVPVAMFAWWVARGSVRESFAQSDSKAPLDWWGACLSGVGLFFVIWALIALPDRGATVPVLLALVGGAALLTVFGLVEARLGDRAMTPLTIFANRTFSGLSLLTLLLYGALGGLLVLLPYVLIRELGYSATAAGAAILPFPLVLGLLSQFVGGTMVERFGTKLMLTGGSLLVALGFGLFAVVPAQDVNYVWHLLPALLVLALGMAATVAPLTAAVLNSVGAQYAGVASGINNAISRIAGLIATSFLGFVLIGSSEDLMGGFALAAAVGVMLALLSAAAAYALVTVED